MAKKSEAAAQLRHRSFRRAVKRVMEDEMVPQYVMAEKAGVHPNMFSRYMVQGHEDMALEKFCRLASTAKFTGREVCAIIGVQYE